MTRKFIVLLLTALVMSLITIYTLQRTSLQKDLPPKMEVYNTIPNITNSFRISDTTPPVELTFRMSLDKLILERAFCMLLRSTVVFWNNNYGDVVIILDESDRPKNFSHLINSLGIPLRFRIVYEKDPKNTAAFQKVAKLSGNRPFGYSKQLYSSFLMDLYTAPSAVIAWIDTDAAFTLPITDRSIYKDGKLIAMGWNSFHISHVHGGWVHSTLLALGLPFLADFMTFFPTYLYASTIKNCREYIMKRFKTDNWEDAFLKISAHHMLSPVNIIYAYAFYFEKERYDWHIDIGLETLEKYNKDHLPKDRPLLVKDTLPELHVAMHYRYFYDRSKGDPIEIGICYAKISLGEKNIPHCHPSFYNEPNTLLYTFEYRVRQFDAWCRGANRKLCLDIISERYQEFANSFKKKGIKTLDTSKIKVIEDIASTKFGVKCPPLKYV